MLKTLVRTLLLLLITLNLYGQEIRSGIIDDSTKLVYGPKTTLTLKEWNLFNETDQWNVVDTTLTDFYKFTFLERKDMKWTDLGAIGTALRPLFHEPESSIGARTGQDVFKHYFKAPEDFRYFDTKSPYIEFSLMLGGKGRSITDVLVSRNVTPQLNFGIHIQKLTVDKQIGSIIEGDRNATGTSYDAFGSFFTKKKTYGILANYSRTKHIVFETGGVDPATVNRFRSYFNDDADILIDGPQSREKRRNFHTYQELKIAEGVKLYHTFDRYYQENDFVHFLGSADTLHFFDNFYVNEDTTAEETRFSYYRNEGGFKGQMGKVFYNVFYRNRLTDFEYKYADSLNLNFDTRKSEHYLGGKIAYRLDSINEVEVEGEYLLDGNYKIDARIKTKWLDARFYNSKYQPGIIYRSYFGNHDRWENDFKDPIFLKIQAEGKVKAGPLELRPGASFTQISHYTYFNQDTVATQAANTVGYISPSLNIEMRLPWHLNFQSEIIYTNFLNETKSYVNIPKFLVNAHLYYRNKLLKGSFDTQIGVRAYWQEDYFADNYYPVLQQYFYQDIYKTPTSIKLDFYVSFRVRSALVFFKLVNLKQMFFGEGNLVAPFYPQQRSAFDLGFTWYFYD